MAKRKSTRSPERLGPLLGAVIDRLGVRGQLNEARVLDAWQSLCGERVSQLTGRAWVKTARNGRCTLHVRIESATWRHELHFQRSDWREKLNAHLEEPLVDEVRFS